MSRPHEFPLVLTQAMQIITVMYLLVAIVGYGVYGHLTVSPILLNLSSGK